MLSNFFQVPYMLQEQRRPPAPYFVQNQFNDWSQQGYGGNPYAQPYLPTKPQIFYSADGFYGRQQNLIAEYPFQSQYGNNGIGDWQRNVYPLQLSYGGYKPY